MKYLITLLLSCALLPSFGQVEARVTTNAPMPLPKDNGSTTSFCESVKSESANDLDVVCKKWQANREVRVLRQTNKDVEAYFVVNEMGNGLVGRIFLNRSEGAISYCVQDFHVNNVPFDEWLATANPVVAEQVKSRIFSETVFLLYTMREAVNDK